MEKLTCQNCGAPLSADGRCSYCGTRYKIDYTVEGPRYVTIYSSPVQTLACQAEIPHRYRSLANEEELSKMAVSDLAHKLADGLTNFMRVDVEEDPFRRATIIRGTVRVVPPDFRY